MKIPARAHTAQLFAHGLLKEAHCLSMKSHEMDFQALLVPLPLRFNSSFTFAAPPSF